MFGEEAVDPALAEPVLEPPRAEALRHAAGLLRDEPQDERDAAKPNWPLRDVGGGGGDAPLAGSTRGWVPYGS